MNLPSKKIKIVKCSGEFYWYRNEIGKEFEVIDHTRKDYMVLDDYYLPTIQRLIKKDDCNG